MLPCYNEGEDIGPLVRKWMDMRAPLRLAGYELSVYCIDDKSKDDTNAVIRQLAKDFPGAVHLIEHEVNKGLGGGLRTSFQFFYDNGREGDLCVLMDGDNTHDPIYVLDMIPKIKAGNDCVIASRYCAKSETMGVSGLRLFMSWGAKQFYTLLLGVRNVRDYTCGYRAYTYDLIARAKNTYGDLLVEKRSFACMMEVLYKLSLIDARFAEIPFELRYDHKQGESKMRIIRTARESMGTAIHLRAGKHKFKKSRNTSEPRGDA